MQTVNHTVRAAQSYGLGRRFLLKLAGASALALGTMAIPAGTAAAQSTATWDKTFAKSDRVDHQKVSYTNRLGIRLVADLYIPKGLDRSRKHAAMVVGTPFGAVKEQSSGLYAQTMAERGFIAIAHDPSYVGESGGQPHNTASQEALVEDFSAGVDYLGSLPFVDRERIGVAWRVRQRRFRTGGGRDRSTHQSGCYREPVRYPPGTAAGPVSHA